MMKCPVCKRPARVLQVDEKAPDGVKIQYVCANPVCTMYKRMCGEEIRERSKETK